MSVQNIEAGLHDLADRRRRRSAAVLFGLALLLAAWAIFSIGHGPVQIAPGRILEILIAALQGQSAGDSREALIVLNIRLPRTLLALMIGANLAASGALMQSLFRNPLADPGLVGVSAGAGTAAALTIILGDKFASVSSLAFGALPVAAFCGALATTLLLYLIATRGSRTSVATMLLAGIALGALASAITGCLVYVADDRQLRDLTFWTLGSLGGATWAKVYAVAPSFVLMAVCLPFLSRNLNAFAIGEAEAYCLGLPVQRIKTVSILLVALAAGSSVAAAGIIGFVGIVVPHLLRLALGPDHGPLLPACLLLGGSLLLAADTGARSLVAPAELPIGILTALIGAPFFLWLLLRRAPGFDG